MLPIYLMKMNLSQVNTKSIIQIFVNIDGVLTPLR